MKKVLHALVSFIMVLAVSSCDVDTIKPEATARINVINASVGNGSVKVNASTNSSFAYSRAPDLAYGASAIFGAFPGMNQIKVVSSTDTTKIFFSRSLDLRPVSTLYIAGRSPNIDTLFRTENNIPYIQPYKDDSDQSIYIRFVNLSPNSTPLSINIRSSTTSEVPSLEYKAITEFKKYPALATTANYIFDIKDIATNTVRTSVTVPITTNRYKTISLIVKGLMGTTTGTDIFNVLQVNYN